MISEKVELPRCEARLRLDPPLFPAFCSRNAKYRIWSKAAQDAHEPGAPRIKYFMYRHANPEGTCLCTQHARQWYGDPLIFDNFVVDLGL